MVRKKIKLKIDKRKKTSILSVAELCFWCTALLHDKFYHCMKFKHSFYSFEVKALTKLQSKYFHVKINKGK